MKRVIDKAQTLSKEFVDSSENRKNRAKHSGAPFATLDSLLHHSTKNETEKNSPPSSSINTVRFVLFNKTVAVRSPFDVNFLCATGSLQYLQKMYVQHRVFGLEKRK